MVYRIKFDRKAEKYFDRLPEDIQYRMKNHFKKIENDPNSSGEPLTGNKKVFGGIGSVVTVLSAKLSIKN